MATPIHKQRGNVKSEYALEETRLEWREGLIEGLKARVALLPNDCRWSMDEHGAICPKDDLCLAGRPTFSSTLILSRACAAPACRMWAPSAISHASPGRP